MGVPTITSVTPTSGRTGGRVLLTVFGSNFRLPTPPPATGDTSGLTVHPSVRVSFIGAKTRVSSRVFVLSTTQLAVLVPTGDAGPVALKVENIDDSGALIGAETVTRAAAYTYKRPDLSAQPAAGQPESSALLRVCREILQALKREVTEDVSLTVHTEWDGNPTDALNIIEFAALPGLVIVGPRLVTNRMYSRNAARQTFDPADPSIFYQERPAKTRDLAFDVLGAANVNMQNLALMDETEKFFERNPYLSVPAGDGATTVDYEMQVPLGADFEATTKPNTDNIFQFKGSFVIRGVELTEDDMVVLKGRQTVDILPTGASPDAVVPSAVLVGSNPATPVGQSPAGSPPGQQNAFSQPPPLSIEQKH